MQLKRQLSLSTHFSDLSLDAQHLSGRRRYALGTNWQTKDHHKDLLWSWEKGELARHGRTPCLWILALITRPRALVGSVLPNRVIGCHATKMLKAPSTMGVRADGLEDRQARFNLETELADFSVTTSKHICTVEDYHVDTGCLGAGGRISGHNILYVLVPSIDFGCVHRIVERELNQLFDMLSARVVPINF
jgi:hypothetical protein